MNEKKSECKTVTVVMPVYNCENYIESAIRSVMKQTYSNWKLIVVDDRSTDLSCQIVKRLQEEDSRVALIHNEGEKGASVARNLGLDNCTSDYIAFLDSDDVWEPQKLECQLSAMQAADAAISYTSYSIIDELGNSIRSEYIVPKYTNYESMLRENVIGCSTVIITKDIASKYRFTTNFYHEDYCLWLDLIGAGYIAVGCQEVLTKWRYLPNSRSFDKKSSARNRWKIYRHHLKLPFFKSVRVFLCYTINGIKKYFS